MTWLAFAAAIALVGAIAVRSVGVAPTAPSITFDEHAAVATALLQPDAPLFTATDEALLAFADEWLTYVDALPCTEES